MKQWDDAAESWVDFVRKGKDYYRDELNNPATFRLIGNVARAYFGARENRIQWKMERLLKPFETTSFHRTLTDYFDTLYRNRLVVRRLVELQPTKRGTMKFAPLKEVMLRPHSIVAEAVRESTRLLGAT
jgi:hypothetical protein